MKRYEAPVLEVIALSDADVITTSCWWNILPSSSNELALDYVGNDNDNHFSDN